MRTLSKVLFTLGILSFLIIFALKMDTYREATNYYSGEIDAAIEKIRVLENAHGQEVINNEQGTTKDFKGCYSTLAGNIFMIGMFSPHTFDLNDPQMKQFIVEFCKFYYEKTGLWVNMMEDQDIITKHISEFWKEYSINDLPQPLINYWKDSYNNN